MQHKKTILRIGALITGALGLIIIGIVLYPIAEHELVSRQKYPILLNPVVDTNILLESKQEVADYTKASSWFPNGSEKSVLENSRVSFFTLSIPALDIEDATVSIGGEDLKKSLVQYSGTALPGRIGNAVIFGHSVLPIYYDPTDYVSIFSTLPTLEEGDEIYVNYDGVKYKYVVETMFEVLPTDIYILDQDSGDPYLSLVTCTPPGDPRKPKRLVVRAKIEPYSVKQANADTRN